MLLVERERVFSQLDDLLDKSAKGTTSLAIVSGPETIGKTAVLQQAAARATTAGITVVSGTCAPDEWRRPYSTLARLFRFPPSAARSLAPASGARVDPLAVGRSVATAVSELPTEGPLLVTVDDVQHADLESLRCLRRWVTRGHPGRPVAVVLAWERAVRRRAHHPLEELLADPRVRRIHLRPLSERGVAALVERRLGRLEPDSVIRVYYALTGGNPLLLDALLTDAQARAISPGQPPDRRPGPPHAVAGGAFRDALLSCLRRAGPVALDVSRGVALLDDATDVPLLSRLSGVSAVTVRGVLQQLSEMGVLDGTRFRSDSARKAVLDDMPVRSGAELRYRAAHLLHDEGMSAGSVAERLVAAGPLKQEWAVSVLVDAAAQAMNACRAALALDYLRLACDCCSQESRQHDLRSRMAFIHWLRAPATSHSRFLAMKPAILRGNIDWTASFQTVAAMLWNLHFEDSFDIIDHFAPRGLGDHADTNGETQYLRLLVSSTFPGLQTRVGSPPPAELVAASTSGARGVEVQAVHALTAVLTRRADERTIAQAEQALLTCGVVHGSCGTIVPAILALVYSDLVEPASAWCERFLTGASSHHVAAWQGTIGSVSAVVSLREGHLDVAVAKAEAALEHLLGDTMNESSVLALATLAEAHTAIGNDEAAAAVLDRPLTPSALQTRAGLHYLHARGRHHLAAGRPHAALTDFLSCGERMVAWGIDTPALVPWRAAVAQVHLSLGDAEPAIGLLAVLTSKRGGELARAEGVALRCLAAAREPHERLVVLERALRLLQQSGDRYETARTLAEIGAAHQLLGDRARSAAAVRRARRIAESCHATRLSDTLARDYPPDGGEAAPDDSQSARLSDSERRVAALAARGLSNREIADRLGVTVSTVEQHLTRVYRKMRIRSRGDLPTGLGADAARSG